jgi:hypothetical protein
MQVSPWGLPMITHLLLNDPGNRAVKETFNKSAPSDDLALFCEYTADYPQKITSYAGSAVNPEEYGKQMVARLCPNTLPYDLAGIEKVLANRIDEWFGVGIVEGGQWG